MKPKTMIIILLSVLAMISQAEASTKKLKVLLTIPPTVEKALAAETKSYIARELRALNDVEQIEKDPTSQYFFISIYPISVSMSNGQSGGVVVSYVFEKGKRIEHNVLIGSPNELKTLCEKIVAHFDTYWLGPERKRH